jgi:hypothetical protein
MKKTDTRALWTAALPHSGLVGADVAKSAAST